MVSHFNTAMMSAKGGKIAGSKGSSKNLIMLLLAIGVGVIAYRYYKKNNIKTTKVAPEDEY
jgi:hypothetical protein